MLKAVDVAFNFQPFSAVLKFAPQNGTFLRTTVTLALRALIRQHKLCPSLGVTTGDFLPFKLNSQFHTRFLVAREIISEFRFKTFSPSRSVS
jgi:hypothetical protein